MYKIICKDLTGELCDFVATEETKEEVKSNFYKHGEESPLHKEAYKAATPEEAGSFEKKLDEYLAAQE